MGIKLIVTSRDGLTTWEKPVYVEGTTREEWIAEYIEAAKALRAETGYEVKVVEEAVVTLYEELGPVPYEI